MSTVNLSKGAKVNLSKEYNISEFCVGANWGKAGGLPARKEIKKTGGFFGFGGSENEVDVPATPGHIAVDLDLSLGLYDSDNYKIETIYYGNKTCPGVKHFGDDLTGDSTDDGKDNETIQVKLASLPAKVTKIIFVLNSFNRDQDFHSTPYSGIRLYEGTPGTVKKEMAKFSVDSAPEYAGKRSLILGSLIKNGNNWEFTTIGEVTDDAGLQGTLKTAIKKGY